MFVGRERELSLLREFQARRSAGLVVCRGRRRIGKSTLIEQFGKACRFYEFYGLAPRAGISNADQLAHFGEQMGVAFDLPPMHFRNWHDALSTLAGLTAEGEVVILLDEISWLASKDRDFAGKLKGVWDTRFKKNDDLMLVLCGSVTSWIDANILNDKGFVGRVSLTLTLDELSLFHANMFWGDARVSDAEKLRILCVTGGVPRYLEEVIPGQSAEQNIKRMCFAPEGLLFSEFDKIFQDIFGRRSATSKRVVQALSGPALEPGELCKVLGLKPGGELSKRLAILVASGMLARDYSWDLSGRQTAISQYRIRDNYLRFYLRYIDSERSKISQGLFRHVHLDNLQNWDSIIGLQLENLILNNLNAVIQRLGIAPESIISAAPLRQHQTKRHQGCQMDLLIHTRRSVYVCEIKFRNKIEGTVVDEVGQKIARLCGKNGKSIRPVLIYQGELAPSIRQSDFFAALIPIGDFLRDFAG